MSLTTFSEYQAAAFKTAMYPGLGRNMVYPALGLAGEAGETADKIKKFYRNSNGVTSGALLNPLERSAIAKEAGDVLWYLAALAYEIDIPLEKIAEMNIDKLSDRAVRGVIKSQGDER